MIDKIKLVAAILIIVVSIFAYYRFADVMQLARIGIIIAGVAAGAGVMLTTATGQSAFAFIKGANVERQKVVWPTRREAMQVTIMVIVLTIILGLLMWLFDSLSFYGIYDLVLRVRGG
ncbi:MAG: preprotein translocase subunit SecE [Gammaproteobacteria bacterium]|nr:preprotein translocase subunit SecE [Gammaproteobacteria bacterium]